MSIYDSLIVQVEDLKTNFTSMTDKILKDLHRQQIIIERSDKRQRREYDELQRRLKEVEDLHREITDTQTEVVFTMAAIAESRSHGMGNHVQRVAEYAKLFAHYYGLDEKESELIKHASPMHDLGKVGIPDAILNKPGRLNEAEWEIMITHSQLGYEMLKDSKLPLLHCAAIIAHEHHEKWNGTGYPLQLAGENIHIYGRIIALADAFDALCSNRCYKTAWNDEAVFELIRKERGEHFDPRLVDIFFEHVDELLAIREDLKDA